jgi:ABC-2 type transport system permease protein
VSLFAASLRREARLLRARPWDAAMLTWVPLLAMALLCWIFAAGQPYRLPIAVWDEDHSALSRQLVRMLEATPGLALRVQTVNRAEAAGALQRMAVYGVVHIPPGMARDVKQGRGASVTLLHNAQLATASSLLQRDLRQVVGTLSAGIEMQAAARRGTPAQALQARMEPVKTQLVALFNVSTNYEQFLAAALVPALVHILAMTAGAWSVGRELRDRTVADWLGARASPAQVLAALLGKLAVAFVPLWACAMACLLYLAQLRGWAVAGSMAWIGTGLAALVAVSLAAGAALAGATLSLRTALSGAGLLSAPAFAFSGVAYPLLAMGEGARTWALAMPYTHYARLQLEQWQMGAPVAHSLPVAGGLLLATLALLLAATAGLARGLRLPHKWGGR